MTRKAIVLGTGGHCRVILSIIAAVGHHDVLALIELGLKRPGEIIMGIPVKPTFDYLYSFDRKKEIDVFLAVGNNNTRNYWWEKVKQLNFSMPNLISPHSLVDNSAYLGESNVICARAFIGPQAQLGNNNLINTAAVVEHEVCIGNDCHVGPSATIAGRSRLDDFCFVGAGATIIDGISVATNSVLGAGATMVNNADEPGWLYIGTPAKRSRTVS